MRVRKSPRVGLLVFLGELGEWQLVRCLAGDDGKETSLLPVEVLVGLPALLLELSLCGSEGERAEGSSETGFPAVWRVLV